jgi:hypothetical protein
MQLSGLTSRGRLQCQPVPGRRKQKRKFFCKVRVAFRLNEGRQLYLHILLHKSKNGTRTDSHNLHTVSRHIRPRR